MNFKRSYTNSGCSASPYSICQCILHLASCFLFFFLCPLFFALLSLLVFTFFSLHRFYTGEITANSLKIQKLTENSSNNFRAADETKTLKKLTLYWPLLNFWLRNFQLWNPRRARTNLKWQQAWKIRPKSLKITSCNYLEWVISTMIILIIIYSTKSYQERRNLRIRRSQSRENRKRLMMRNPDSDPDSFKYKPYYRKEKPWNP